MLKHFLATLVAFCVFGAIAQPISKEMVVKSAQDCLAINIYHEARGESKMGQEAVASVTMNRAEQDRSKVCREVFRYKQFSWTNDLVSKVKKGVWKLDQSLIPRERAAWAKAQKIAAAALTGKMRDRTRGATHYHTTDIAPYWKWSLTPTKLIGKHQFYSKDDPFVVAMR